MHTPDDGDEISLLSTTLDSQADVKSGASSSRSPIPVVSLGFVVKRERTSVEVQVLFQRIIIKRAFVT